MQPRLETCSKRIRRRAAALIPTLTLLLTLHFAVAPPAARAQSPGDPADEIVYIDPSGVVRVRDPLPAAGTGVTWYSPVGGYTDAVLLDLNGDTDLEIAALRESGDGRSLDIYDPVLATGPVAPGQSIGGVPWALITSIPIVQPVGILAAGDIDLTAPGDEILLSARVVASGTGDATLYKQSVYYLRNEGARDGRAWEAVGLPISSEDWTSAALGDMNGDGIDEIGLVAGRTGTLSVWQMRGSGDAARVYKNESDNRPWLDVAMGPFRGGNDMLGAVRDAPLGLPSLVILRWDNGSLADEYGREFDPSPNFIFFGDINGSGDAETYMIRYVDSAVTGKARLIMRQQGADPAALLEDVLDADNGYKVGAAGDIDGDGKDEVVLIRNNGIREYMSPDTATSFTPTALQSNSRTLVIGDLDRVGYLPEVNLQAAPSLFVASAPSGTPSTLATITISGSPSSPAIPINATVSNHTGWLNVTPNSSMTPAQLTLTFDASALLPGTYSTNLVISSASPLVLQQPLVVPIRFEVSPGLLVRPTGMAFIFDGCPATGVQTRALEVHAAQGTPYSVWLLSTSAFEATVAQAIPPWPSSVEWLTATSESKIAPGVVTLEADGAHVPEGATSQSARAGVTATVGGQQLVRTVPVTLLCATTRVRLPVVARQ